MPRSTDWKDYIPARGEAEVGMKLKGSYGGKSMNRFRRRGASRFRGSKRVQRFWVPHTWQQDSANNNFPVDFGQTGYNVPVRVIRITPLGGFGWDAAEPTLADTFQWQNAGKAARLLMVQGSIPVRCSMTPETEDQWFDAQGVGNMTPSVTCFWYWKKIRFDTLQNIGMDPAATQSGKYVYSNAPGSQGSLYQMMQQKDILSWGFRTFRPYNPLGMRYAGIGEATRASYDPYTNNPAVQFFPLPRMPKKGFTLAQGEELTLFATPVAQNTWGGVWRLAGSGATQPTVSLLAADEDGSVTPGIMLQAAPMFRALFSASR